jgi:hypothetical protein
LARLRVWVLGGNLSPFSRLGLCYYMDLCSWWVGGRVSGVSVGARMLLFGPLFCSLRGLPLQVLGLCPSPRFGACNLFTI